MGKLANVIKELGVAQSGDCGNGESCITRQNAAEAQSATLVCRQLIQTAAVEETSGLDRDINGPSRAGTDSTNPVSLSTKHD